MASFKVPVAHRGCWLFAEIPGGFWIRFDPNASFWEAVDNDDQVVAGGVTDDDDPELSFRDGNGCDLDSTQAKLVLAYKRAVHTLAEAGMLSRRERQLSELFGVQIEELRVKVESTWWARLYAMGQNWTNGIGDIRTKAPEIQETADLPGGLSVSYAIFMNDKGARKRAEIYAFGGKRGAAELPEDILHDAMFILGFPRGTKLRPFGMGLFAEASYVPSVVPG